MKRDILTLLEPYPYFTFTSLHQLTEKKPKTLHQMVFRWVEKKHIIRLKQGVYMSQGFYQRYARELYFASLISSIIQPFSYLSTEYILQRQQVLTEGTYWITATTIKNSQSLENSYGIFKYRHIKPELYTGYNVHEYHEIQCAEATLAKALFDYLYFRPLPLKIRTRDYNIAEDWRLNLAHWNPLDIKEFEYFVENYNIPKLTYILTQIQKYVWRP